MHRYLESVVFWLSEKLGTSSPLEDSVDYLRFLNVQSILHLCMLVINMEPLD